MTSIWNDPAEFTAEAVAGFVDLHPQHVRAVTGGVVRRRRPARPKVAVVVGGGSGHYPAFMGLVGRGFADGAVVGNIFTSPSTAQVYSVARAAQSGAGVVLTYGNYAGDVMNFGLAADRLRAEGIDTRHLVVTDDVASAPAAERERRRGIAGDFVVFKALAAAAERGMGLDDVERVGRAANARTFTLGVAYSGCTFPGAEEPLFTVPDGLMGLGLGIHGEPGLRDVPRLGSAELAAALAGPLLAERPADASGRVAVVLDGLGATKYEELFVLWRDVAAILRDAGLTVVAPEAGELVTSLDMGGVSLTVTWLDDELERLWLDPADSPAFRRGAVPQAADEPEADGDAPPESAAVTWPAGDPESRLAARQVVASLAAVSERLHAIERDLAHLDSVAGDGDHGRGMVRGADHALGAARAALDGGAGCRGVLAAAGDTWAEQAGGTSGVLWGAGLRAFGGALGDAGTPGPVQAVAGARAWLTAVAELGKAEVGDKTMVDAAVPFVDVLEERVRAGASLADAWTEAARAAQSAAEATAPLAPRKGRARPLADRSVGTPDPGAVSFAACVDAVARTLVGTRHADGTEAAQVAPSSEVQV